jgi:H+-transporting ATPase
MALVSAYHTDTDPEDPVYHIYDDCPAGERVIKDGNDKPGTGGYRLCDFCARKQSTGKF